MATYTIAGYDVADVVIVSGDDPFQDNNVENFSSVGAIFYVTSEPDVFDVTDNDGVFNDNDGSQDLLDTINQGGGTANPGANITPEYMYTVRPVGGTAADDFYVYHYDAGISGNGQGFVTEYRIVPGQQYEIIAVGPTNDPSVSYSSLYVCFAEGTKLATPDGERPVEQIRQGHLLTTLDGDHVPVRWRSVRNLGLDDHILGAAGLPIRFEPGSLGDGFPVRTLEVSPHHRIMLRSQIAERMFGQSEVFVPARFFLGLPGVSQMTGLSPVRYFHFLVDGHQVLVANGTPAESLFVGPEIRSVLTRSKWKQLREAFGDKPFKNGLPSMTPARQLVEGSRARRLVARHARNYHLPLIEAAHPALETC